MSGDAARVSVSVAVPPEFAFRLFTQDIDRWWRRGRKFRHSASESSLVLLEPRVGGRLLEQFGEGGAFEVGRVEVWEPPRRLCFRWRFADSGADEHTQVEVDFVPSGSGTLVSVVHRGFAALRADHPVRHGLSSPEFLRMIGLWWGEQLTSLRMRKRALGDQIPSTTTLAFTLAVGHAGETMPTATAMRCPMFMS
jgi:uncharacterized protein YndB with AHSA1/START domain